MQAKTVLYADVVVEFPVPKELTYSVPEALSSQVAEGSAVMVPLRTGRARGYVVSLYQQEPMEGIKPLSALIEEIPPLPRELLNTAREVSEHYLHTWGDALKAAVPVPAGRGVTRFRITGRGSAHLRSAGEEVGLPEKALGLLQQGGELSAAQLQRRLKEKGVAALLREMRRKGWVAASRQQTTSGMDGVRKDMPLPALARPLEERVLTSRYRMPALDCELESVWEGIRRTIASGDGRPMLLRASSLADRGKIYLLAADVVTRSGRGVIILKPEIAAARYFIERLRREFNDSLSVTHSGLTAAGRWEQWKRAARGEATIVVGARATALSAVKDLGLIIVDEEDDEAYKQEEIPRYHAREVALIRGREARCAVLLGSSAPSMESLYQAAAGGMEYVNLSRGGGRARPEIEVVDLKPVRSRGTISPLLRERIGETLKKGGQALLFLNRRGYSTFVQCRECGFAMRCPRCDISLTYHTQSGRARCRYCRHEESTLLVCPNCGGNRIWYLGMGTQKVEREARRVFPKTSVCRLDSDTVRESGELSALVERIEKGELRIVVSTQMALPYLREHNFSLAAVICADAILNTPDFRAAEKSFRLVCQLAGPETGPGAGRRVVVQSFSPDHYSLIWARKLDYMGFYEEELKRRREPGYPPLTRMISVRVEGGPHSGAGPLAASVADAVRSRVPEGSDISVLGPTMVHLARARSRIRWQVLLNGRDGTAVEKLARWVLNQYAHRGRGTKAAQVSVDVDPVSFF